jgi:hypothetical protein
MLCACAYCVCVFQHPPPRPPPPRPPPPTSPPKSPDNSLNPIPSKGLTSGSSTTIGKFSSAMTLNSIKESKIDRHPAKNTIAVESSSSSITIANEDANDEEKEGKVLFDRDEEEEEDSSGSCSSLVEALAAARDKEAAEKEKEKHEVGSDKLLQTSKQKIRKNSLFSIINKKKDEDHAHTETAENGKPKLRLTTSHTLSSTTGGGNHVHVPPAPATAAPAPEMRVFVTEGSIRSTSPDETEQRSGEDRTKKDSLAVDDAAMLHKGPRRESTSFVRRMSKKIRNIGGKESEAGNNSSEDDLDGNKMSRQTSKKEKPKTHRFEVIDLTMEDVPLQPPTKKLSYAQLAGMSVYCCWWCYVCVGTNQ